MAKTLVNDSKQNRRTLQELKEQMAYKTGLYNRELEISEFEEHVKDGTINDSNGIAQLVIDGEVRSEYGISIERRVLSRTGQIISFTGLLKIYEPESIKIIFLPKGSMWDKRQLNH